MEFRTKSSFNQGKLLQMIHIQIAFIQGLQASYRTSVHSSVKNLLGYKNAPLPQLNRTSICLSTAEAPQQRGCFILLPPAKYLRLNKQPTRKAKVSDHPDDLSPLHSYFIFRLLSVCLASYYIQKRGGGAFSRT